MTLLFLLLSNFTCYQSQFHVAYRRGNQLESKQERQTEKLCLYFKPVDHIDAILCLSLCIFTGNRSSFGVETKFQFDAPFRDTTNPIAVINILKGRDKLRFGCNTEG